MEPSNSRSGPNQSNSPNRPPNPTPSKTSRQDKHKAHLYGVTSPAPSVYATPPPHIAQDFQASATPSSFPFPLQSNHQNASSLNRPGPPQQHSDLVSFRPPTSNVTTNSPAKLGRSSNTPPKPVNNPRARTRHDLDALDRDFNAPRATPLPDYGPQPQTGLTSFPPVSLGPPASLLFPSLQDIEIRDPYGRANWQTQPTPITPFLMSRLSALEEPPNSHHQSSARTAASSGLSPHLTGMTLSPTTNAGTRTGRTLSPPRINRPYHDRTAADHNNTPTLTGTPTLTATPHDNTFKPPDSPEAMDVPLFFSRSPRTQNSLPLHARTVSNPSHLNSNSDSHSHPYQHRKTDSLSSLRSSNLSLATPPPPPILPPPSFDSSSDEEEDGFEVIGGSGRKKGSKEDKGERVQAWPKCWCCGGRLRGPPPCECACGMPN